MRRLLGVEFRRVFARDITRLLGLIAVAGSVFAGIGAFVSTGGATNSQEAEFDQSILSARALLPDQIHKCTTERIPLASIPPLPLDPQNPRFNEEINRINRANRIQQQKFLEPRPLARCRSELSRSDADDGDRRLHLLFLPGAFEPLILPSAIFALVIGATIIGAEWGAGTIPTLLTWEPRRMRVLGAKVLGVLASCAALFPIFALLLAGTLSPTLLFRGSAVGLDAIWRQDMMSVVLRGMYLPALSGLFGFTFAMLIRNTAAALGVAFGYLLVAESLIRATGSLSAWLVSNNAAVVLVGYSPFKNFFSPQEPVSLALAERSSVEAGLILCAYMLVFASISAFLFHRRDVH